MTTERPASGLCGSGSSQAVVCYRLLRCQDLGGPGKASGVLHLFSSSFCNDQFSLVSKERHGERPSTLLQRASQNVWNKASRSDESIARSLSKELASFLVDHSATGNCAAEPYLEDEMSRELIAEDRGSREDLKVKLEKLPYYQLRWYLEDTYGEVVRRKRNEGPFLTLFPST
jgi:hypothetical protein